MARRIILGRGEPGLIERATAEVSAHTIAVMMRSVWGAGRIMRLLTKGECFTKKTLSWKGFLCDENNVAIGRRRCSRENESDKPREASR